MACQVSAALLAALAFADLLLHADHLLKTLALRNSSLALCASPDRLATCPLCRFGRNCACESERMENPCEPAHLRFLVKRSFSACVNSGIGSAGASSESAPPPPPSVRTASLSGFAAVSCWSTGAAPFAPLAIAAAACFFT